MRLSEEQIKAVMIGHAVGDALGVPVEFDMREELKEHPITDMVGFGTYPVPAGAWSDDTSMSIAAFDSLANGKLDYDEIMRNFIDWLNDGKYTPTGETFDVGRTCFKAVLLYTQIGDYTVCGRSSENSNGNGSLMRIHPFALYTYGKGLELGESLDIIHEASALTHAHTRSKLGCAIYSKVLWGLLEEPTKERALKEMEDAFVMYDAIDLDNHYWSEKNQHKVKPENESAVHCSDTNEAEHYEFVCKRKLLTKTEDEIKSSGYIVDSLEAALWCLLTTNDYKSCVLKAVNLGGDTDSIAAIAGGLAGALYGYDAIPAEWRNKLIRRDYIEEMCERAYKNWNSEKAI